MKSLLLSTVLVIPTILLSYELEFKKTFSNEIQNDKVQTNINISVNSKKIDFINEKIEFFQDFIKEDNSVVKKNGNYNLIPNYSYKNNVQKFVGYKGSLSYTIESAKYEILDKFVGDIIDIKNNMNSKRLQLTVSNVQWIVSDKLQDKNIDKLQLDAISWIKNYKNTLPGKCVIKNISINKNNAYSNRRYNNVAVESTSSMKVSPIQTKKSITLTANYKLDCK